MKTIILYNDGHSIIYHYYNYRLIGFNKDIYAARISDMSLGEALDWLSEWKTIMAGEK